MNIRLRTSSDRTHLKHLSKFRADVCDTFYDVRNEKKNILSHTRSYTPDQQDGSIMNEHITAGGYGDGDGVYSARPRLDLEERTECDADSLLVKWKVRAGRFR